VQRDPGLHREALERVRQQREREPALERFAMQAGITLHVEARGEDDHHVAEAAFKALGRALREACATGASGSTKGQL